MSDQLSLDLGTEIVDILTLARMYAQQNRSSGQTQYVTQDHKGRFWYKTRTFYYDVDWDMHFQIPSVAAAMAIVDAGLAWFHSSVDKEIVELHEFSTKMRKK